MSGCDNDCICPEDTTQIQETDLLEIVSAIQLPSMNLDVDVLGDYAYVAAGQAGMHIINIENHGHPYLIKTLDTVHFANGVAVVRSRAQPDSVDIALIVEGSEGIMSFDVTDPENAYSLDYGTTAIDGHNAAIVEADEAGEPFLLFLAEGWKGVRVFHESQSYPGRLEYNGVFAGTLGSAVDLVVREDFVYVADDRMGLAVLDASILVLGEFEEIAWYDTPGNALGVTLEDHLALIADGDWGLSIFDVTDPTSPGYVNRVDLEGQSLAVEVVDSYAVVACGSVGISVVDIQDPTDPICMGYVLIEDVTNVYATEDGLILATTEWHGLYILELRD